MSPRAANHGSVIDKHRFEASSFVSHQCDGVVSRLRSRICRDVARKAPKKHPIGVEQRSSIARLWLGICLVFMRVVDWWTQFGYLSRIEDRFIIVAIQDYRSFRVGRLGARCVCCRFDLFRLGNAHNSRRSPVVRVIPGGDACRRPAASPLRPACRPLYSEGAGLASILAVTEALRRASLT